MPIIRNHFEIRDKIQCFSLVIDRYRYVDRYIDREDNMEITHKIIGKLLLRRLGEIETKNELTCHR